MNAHFADAYRLAEPFAGATWTDEPQNPDAEQTVAVLTAARAIVLRAARELRALAEPAMRDTWVESPSGVASRLTDEAVCLADCIKRVEGGE